MGLRLKNYAVVGGSPQDIETRVDLTPEEKREILKPLRLVTPPATPPMVLIVHKCYQVQARLENVS